MRFANEVQGNSSSKGLEIEEASALRSAPKSIDGAVLFYRDLKAAERIHLSGAGLWAMS